MNELENELDMGALQEMYDVESRWGVACGWSVWLRYALLGVPSRDKIIYHALDELAVLYGLSRAEVIQILRKAG